MSSRPSFRNGRGWRYSHRYEEPGENTPAAQATASTLAADMFAANYGAGAPTPTITFPVNSSGDQQVRYTATVNVNTYFMRYLSNWATVPVADTAVATRGKLVMSIVLDRSGSMTSDGGETALVNAVPLFVDKFDNSLDKVALLSFSSNARIDFPIATGFQTPISNDVPAWCSAAAPSARARVPEPS